MSEGTESFDRLFDSFVIGNASLEKLWTGARWAEGPVWFGDARCLLFSDIPNDRMLRWVEGGPVTVFRQPANYTNGHYRDGQGRLISCEHGGRRVTRTEVDGSITVVADRFEGGRLNSPNDVVVKSDGSVWFTDPPYGIYSHYEGHKAESEYGGQFVFRADPETGAVDVMAEDFVRPNGLAFSPDETILYIADSGLTEDHDGPHHIRAFDVEDGRRLTGGRILIEVSPGFPDGLRVDTEGFIWSSAADGVHCYAPDGRLLGKILVPETVANVTFGGPERNRLFVTATSSLYSIYLNREGAQRP